MEDTIHKNTATATREKVTALLIANPTSGNYLQPGSQLSKIIAFLQQHGWQAELRLTQASGDARTFAREAVQQGANVVVAIGGDGTIHEIIQELAGSETALGVIPHGTVNVWAREVGIPLDEAGACSVLLNGQTRSIDLCQINDRYFLLMVGIGIDGAVTHAVDKKLFKRLGIFSYLLIATWFGFGYPAFQVHLALKNRTLTIRALQVIIGNTQLYGGALKYTWQAKCDDGLLDICVVRKQSGLRRLTVLLDFLLHRHQRHQWVRYETAKAVKIQTSRPVHIQVDGEAMGYTTQEPTTFTVAPGALKVIVPNKLPSDLFSKETENISKTNC